MVYKLFRAGDMHAYEKRSTGKQLSLASRISVSLSSNSARSMVGCNIQYSCIRPVDGSKWLAENKALQLAVKF
jgi:phage gpG-like protein